MKSRCCDTDLEAWNAKARSFMPDTILRKSLMKADKMYKYTKDRDDSAAEAQRKGGWRPSANYDTAVLCSFDTMESFIQELLLFVVLVRLDPYTDPDMYNNWCLLRADKPPSLPYFLCKCLFESCVPA